MKNESGVVDSNESCVVHVNVYSGKKKERI